MDRTLDAPIPPRPPRVWGGPLLCAVIGLALLWQTTSTTFSGDMLLAPTTAGDALSFFAVSLLLAAPAVALTRFPVSALLLLMLGMAVIPGVVHGRGVPLLQTVLILVAVGHLAATRRRRVSAAYALAAAVFLAAWGFAWPPPDAIGLFLTEVFLFAALLAWMLGRGIGRRRAHDAAVHRHATQEAVVAERLRIARELHDMVAHSVGIIAIQAGVGRRVIDTQPEEARNALAAIEATSRETLAGMRRTVTALRRTDPRPADEAAARAPAPGLADLDRLAAATADAGVHVEVRRTGPRTGRLPADIDLSAYRIVQEAVTNVVRHAGTDRARVHVAMSPTELRLEIEDDGRGGVPDGVGFGLVGMRERAALLHGELTAGPRPGGGFRVAARLPLPADATPEPARTRTEADA